MKGNLDIGDFKKLSSDYPLLTAKNLQYWYWECEPGYSLLDIAKVTGASYSRVQRFMEKHDIPRRDKSEANKNRFECEFKKSAFLETMQSEEFRAKISIASKKVWSDPQNRKKMAVIAKNKLSGKQIDILYLASRFDGLFQADLVPVLKKDSTNISGALKTLFERGLLRREKCDNLNTKSYRSLQFKYFITKGGRVILTSRLSELIPEHKKRLSDRAVLYTNLKEKIVRISFGENQKKLLKVIIECGRPMFISDFHELVNLDSKAICKALARLTMRKILYRVRERNNNSLRDNPYQYKYSLSELGERLAATLTNS